MNAQYQKLIGLAAVALLLIVGLSMPLFAQSDLSAELEKALQPAGQADGVVDPATWLRLQALVRQAVTTEQLHLIETRLVETLGSEASLVVKRDICRVLWQIGSAQSAPALKKLLAQPETADIACYAIANNPATQLGQAVRDALGGSTGRVAISLLILLGQRRDTKAVEMITPFLQHEQPDVAAAAALALGRIGGRPSVAALDQFRQTVPKDRRGMADEAYLRAMETLDSSDAIPLWNELVAARAESAMVRRGALLRLSETGPGKALAWLLAALRDEQSALKPAVGQALRCLTDPAVVAQVSASLLELPASSQAIVIEALGHALPTESLVALIRQPGARTAVRWTLGAREEPQAVVVLLAEALSPDPIDDRPELFGLLRNVPGETATDTILKALPAAPAPLLSDLVKVLAAREAKVPLSFILERARAGDNDNRLHAIRALRFAATASDHAALFQLLATASEPKIHEAVEETIAAVFSRSGNAQQQADWLLETLDSAQRSQDRKALRRLLAGTGTPAALQRVLKQVREGEAEDREAAFLALTQWPNDAALEPLLELAGGHWNEAQRTSLVRGAVRLLRESPLPASKQADCFRRLAPLSADPANRKLLLSGLAQVHDSGALELIMPSLDDPAVRTEAALAAIAAASHLGSGDDAAVNAAMNKVLAVEPDAKLRNQAQAQIRLDPEGFTPIYDGHGFAGWEGNQQVFRIEENAIVGGSLKQPGPRNEFLCTTNLYSDFELRLKFKLLGDHANGGVQIRSRRVPGSEVAGYQADLGQACWGNLYDESRRNQTLVQANQTELKKVLEPSGWNDYRIRCEGRRIRLWINGQQTVDYTEADDRIARTGIIGLQIHGGPPSEAWYKDIAIRRLPQ